MKAYDNAVIRKQHACPSPSHASALKVAIVHYWLVGMRGAEVLKTLLDFLGMNLPIRFCI